MHESPIMPRNFLPWIGSLYHSDGLDGVKLLILGESHYGPTGTETECFTRKIVKELGQEKRHRFFTTTAKLVLGLGADSISDKDRAAFWEKVAFANYIQSFVAENAKDRTRPTEAMWQNAKVSLIETLQDVQPDAMLILGLDIEAHLPKKIHDSVPIHTVRHPSQFFRYADWMPGVQQFLFDAVTAV